MGKYTDLTVLFSRESEQVEWKENVADIDDVIRTIVAFSNDYSNLGGGYVVCGVKETKDEAGFPKIVPIGLSSTRFKEIEGKVLNSCANYVDPAVVPLTDELDVESSENKILIFIVPASKHAHIFRSKDDCGKYFVRIGRSTIEARDGILRELLVRKGAKEPWDRAFPASATVEDLDLIAFRDLLQKMGVWDPSKGVDEYLSPASQISPFVPPFCSREPLIGTVRPRNFSLLLFGRNVQSNYPDAHSMFSVYPGTDRSEPWAERLEISGTMPNQINIILERLNTESYTAMDKSDESRPNVVKYPRRALHEAVVNALCHRDYEATNPVRITVFSDRVEIYSPGGLPTAINKEQFLLGKATPVWRNQSLAWFLNKLQLAQAEGQGIATIIRTMKEEGCPEPIFEITDQSVTCTLPAHPRHAKLREIRNIEHLVSIGNITEALEKTESLLSEDPFNFRTIQLYCELLKTVQDPGRVRGFIARYSGQVEKLATAAQLIIGETILSMPKPHAQEMLEIAFKLLKSASMNRVEEVEARKLLISLLHLDAYSDVYTLIQRYFIEHPAWKENPVFLQIQGNALLQFAKKCMATAKRFELTPRLRANAWDECRSYLAQAERSLRLALDHTPDMFTKERIVNDLDFIEKLKAKSQKRKR